MTRPARPASPARAHAALLGLLLAAALAALVEAGADTRIGDRQGVMPAELANSLGYVSMVRLIGQAPARPQGAPVPR
ncbi:MAG: hypothetical protein ACK5PW_08090 [Burkholderiales bacterium]